MTRNSKHEAAIPNPALDPLRNLVGEWKTVGAHPYFPDTVFHGHNSFQWIEGGAFLMMHSEIDEPGIPSGISIFGSDDATGEYFMLYFDERKVSRKYDVSFQDTTVTWSRNSPAFSQRMTMTFTDKDTIICKGEMCRDGKAWENDLELTLTRVNG